MGLISKWIDNKSFVEKKIEYEMMESKKEKEGL